MKKTIFTAAAACLAAFGCSTMNTAENLDKQGSRQMVDDRRVITDASLNDYAYVAGINRAEIGGGIMKAQVEIVNSSSAFRQVNYRFEWFDENGMLVDSPLTPWLTTSIEPGESKFLSSVAPNARAKDFTIKLTGNVRE